MPITYRGIEPDAVWRKEAWMRHEQHRNSDVTIVVTDAQGNAVPNAQVSLEQTRLAYIWSAN